MRLCGPDGTTDQLRDDCYSSEHCVDGQTSCSKDVCTNGQPVCSEGLLATCSADGSSILDDGVPCDEGEVCDTNACLPVMCTPNEESCDGVTLRVCNPLGTGYSSSTNCSSTTYCALIAPGDAECVPDLCQSGQATCAGEVVATCDSTGAPTLSLGTDCSATDKLCDGMACVDEVVESVGTTDNSSSSSCNGYMIANRYYFGKARKLTELEQYLNVGTGTIQLRWFVYESTDGYTFQKVFEKLTTSTGTDFHSSGVLDVALSADKYYALGVRPTTACTRYYESGMSRDFLESGGRSDGSMVTYNNGNLSTSWSVSTSSSIYRQRLTFE